MGHLSGALSQLHTCPAKQNPVQLNTINTNGRTALRSRFRLQLHDIKPEVTAADTDLQQLTALLQPALLGRRAGFHVAHEDPGPISSNYGDVVGQAGSSELWRGGGA